jgi:hypothetical protein
MRVTSAAAAAAGSSTLLKQSPHAGAQKLLADEFGVRLLFRGTHHRLRAARALQQGQCWP